MLMLKAKSLLLKLICFLRGALIVLPGPISTIMFSLSFPLPFLKFIGVPPTHGLWREA